MNPLTRLVCHGPEPGTRGLVFCLRCSGVYAGILAGVIVSGVRALRLRLPCGRVPLAAALAAFPVMFVVGFGKLAGFVPACRPLEIFTALWFGWALGVLSATVIEREWSPGRMRPPGSPRPFAWGQALVFALFPVISFFPDPLKGLLGVLSVAGFFTGLVAVNLAVGIELGVACEPPRARRVRAARIAAFLATGELAAFYLWRRLADVL